MLKVLLSMLIGAVVGAILVAALVYFDSMYRPSGGMWIGTSKDWARSFTVIGAWIGGILGAFLGLIVRLVILFWKRKYS